MIPRQGSVQSQISDRFGQQSPVSAIHEEGDQVELHRRAINIKTNPNALIFADDDDSNALVVEIYPWIKQLVHSTVDDDARQLRPYLAKVLGSDSVQAEITQFEAVEASCSSGIGMFLEESENDEVSPLSLRLSWNKSISSLCDQTDYSEADANIAINPEGVNGS